MKTFYFVVSDTHSFFDATLKALKEKGFEQNNPQHKIILCGDLFDRGPQTKELFNFVKSLEDRFIYIRGNHEDLLEDCVADIVSGRRIGSHHFGNGTVKTTAAFCNMFEWDITDPRRSEEIKQHVFTSMQPVLEFISAKAVNYAELGNFIFVHGWVPTINQNLSVFDDKPLKLAPREWWDDQEDYSSRDVWKEARWTNGMKAWHDGCKIPGKTIVCGHWHCSWGWSHIKNERKEFPGKGREDWLKSFEPFTEDGIIAIDACTAYSGFVNCVKLEVEEDV